LERDIRTRKSQDDEDVRPVRLPVHTLQRLERLRQQKGKESLAEVVAEAVEAYARLHGSEKLEHEKLTQRQAEVLRLIADGHSTKSIAARLKVSMNTAEFHRAKLMSKLGVRGVAGLVRFAIRIGLILP
jgi:DNA-binding NarL/FixJ family response regulator